MHVCVRCRRCRRRWRRRRAAAPPSSSRTGSPPCGTRTPSALSIKVAIPRSFPYHLFHFTLLTNRRTESSSDLTTSVSETYLIVLCSRGMLPRPQRHCRYTMTLHEVCLVARRGGGERLARAAGRAARPLLGAAAAAEPAGLARRGHGLSQLAFIQVCIACRTLYFIGAKYQISR